MESDICRSCRRSLDGTNENNIFQKEILIKSVDFQSTNEKKWYIKASSAIELITGNKVLQEVKLPKKLCQVCFQNVEAFINFRFQLIKSEEILLQSENPDSKKTIDRRQNEIQSFLTQDPSISMANSNTRTKIRENPDISARSALSDRLPISKSVAPEDFINVDDSSISLDINSVHDYQQATNNFSISKSENDQENNNLNNSDSSASNPVHRNEDVSIKQVEHDIESEIDVCSGEDDEVLELDVQKQRNETVEINSSSESDIEVCDYEPVGKKANFNTLSPPIKF